ncbi:MarR family winged helix-turn-helix transcriptional regulator [Paenibacillus sp. S-38]|uniref:MarR family winged helix-turn-helix transcriptional regulator n=1 Tax=Paenibacillus sp. S-38 TaxID=3416710 RepID=UPI003CEC3D7E
MNTQRPEYTHVREMMQGLVHRFGLLQKDGAQCCGVSVLQSHVLYELGRRPNLSLNDLGQVLSADTSTLSRQVHQLVEMRLISRIPDPRDRRFVVLSLTPQGEQQADMIADTLEIYIEGLLRHVPPDKQAQVLESLELLSTAMSRSDSR